MHSSSDKDCGLLESESALFSMCALLLTETVTCFVSVGELALFLMCILLVT